MTLTAEPTERTFTQAALDVLSGKPYSIIPLGPNTESYMQVVAHGMSLFDTRVPRDEQARWAIKVPRDPDHDEYDDGVIRKSNDKPSDQKLVLHARPELPHLLQKNGVTLTEDLCAWIGAAILLRNSIHETFVQFAHAIDEVCSGHCLVERIFETEAGTLTSLARANLYESNGRGYAREHTDRNGATITIGESSPGLYFIGHPDPPPLPPNHGMVFPGQLMERITRGEVKATWHGARTRRACGPSWSQVFFGYFAV